MADRSKIQWTDASWNPVRGCSRVSEGCRNCYAEKVAARFSGTWVTHHEGRRVEIDKDDATLRRSPFKGFAEMVDGAGARWTGKLALVERHLYDPLRWQRGRRIFVNSMSDLFHEALPDEAIDQVFAVMALARHHTFQVLTKRADRMREYCAAFTMERLRGAIGRALLEFAFAGGPRVTITGPESLPTDDGLRLPLANVWLGVSVEDQATADARIPLLLRTPAARRFVSYEPALGPVDFTKSRGNRGDDERVIEQACGEPLPLWDCHVCQGTGYHETDPWAIPCGACRGRRVGLDWIIVGGESGPGARPFDVGWARSTISQCRAARAPVFVKQLGARPVIDEAP